MKKYIPTLLRVLLLCIPLIIIFFGIKYGIYGKVLPLLGIKIFFKTFGMGLCFAASIVLIEKLIPRLSFSFLDFFPKLKNNEKNKNKSTVSKLFGVLLFVAIIPMAYAEEYVFRFGLQNWKEVIVSSILFGLLHFMLFFRASVSISIIFAGLWYSHQYFLGGILLSTAYHSMNNFIASIVVIFLLRLKQKKIVP